MATTMSSGSNSSWMSVGLPSIADITEDESELSADNRQMTYHRFSGLQLMYMPLDAQELDPNGLLSES